jgi:hypothetical protein
LTDVELMSSPISGGFLLDKNTGIPRQCASDARSYMTNHIKIQL